MALVLPIVTNKKKVFSSKAMAKIDFKGKVSPGPKYNVRGMD